MNFYDKYVVLCRSKGTEPRKITKELGISLSSLSKWKNGRIPNLASLMKISEYFNVTINSLVNDEEDFQLIGGSGSGKTRFFVKPYLMKSNESENKQ